MPTSVGIAVVIHNGCLLVGERPSGSTLAGFSELPGGKLHPDESAHHCAVRECLEETGIQVAADRQLSLVEHEYDHGEVMLTFVLCHPLDKHVPPRPPFRWVPLAALVDLKFPPANDGVLRWLTSGIRVSPEGSPGSPGR